MDEGQPLHDLLHIRGWKQCLSPFEMARTSQVDASLNVHIMPSATRSAQYLVPAYQDEIVCLRVQVEALTTCNRKLSLALTRMSAMVTQEMLLKEQVAEASRIEILILRTSLRETSEALELSEQHLVWESRMRRYLEAMATHQIP